MSVLRICRNLAVLVILAMAFFTSTSRSAAKPICSGFCSLFNPCLYPKHCVCTNLFRGGSCVSK
jgi:hypothetical protein